MELNGKRHTPTVLPPGSNPGICLIGGWVNPGSFWTFGERSFALADVRTPDCPARVLVHIHTALSRLRLRIMEALVHVFCVLQIWVLMTGHVFAVLLPSKLN